MTARPTLRPKDWTQLLEDERLGLAPESHLLAMASIGVTGLVARPAPRDAATVIAEAFEAAREADVAVVVVGLTTEEESEAGDKSTLALPGEQDALVFAVAAAARRTVVVVNAGSPVLMPWLEEVDAVLLVGLPGQEGGHAVADVLTGRAEPTGRLVTSYPSADGAAPAWDVTPGEDLGLGYDDGSAVGYRGYHAGAATAPLFWLGAGLGYGSWEHGDVELLEGPTPGVLIEVTNTGSRPSRETVQLYLEPSEAGQPIRLVGYAGVGVEPGASAVVEVRADARLLRAWDTEADGWRPLGDGRLLVARGLGDVRGDVAWSG